MSFEFRKFDANEKVFRYEYDERQIVTAPNFCSRKGSGFWRDNSIFALVEVQMKYGAITKQAKKIL